jgi:hypothetical protein
LEGWELRLHIHMWSQDEIQKLMMILEVVDLVG